MNTILHFALLLHSISQGSSIRAMENTSQYKKTLCYWDVFTAGDSRGNSGDSHCLSQIRLHKNGMFVAKGCHVI